jgi:hypothetical protein
VQIVLEDDLDGGKADETVTFGLDGSTYEVDLSTANAKKLREALAPFVGVGRKVPGRGRRGGSGRGRRGASSAADIRAWARENGYEVSERGRVPAEVRAAYEAAN